MGGPPLIDDAVVAMRTSLDEAASVVTDAIHSNIGALEDDLYFATRQSTRANVGLITTMVGQHADPTHFVVPEEALSYARSYVREGLTFECLSGVYREGQQAYLKLWLEELCSRAKDPSELAVAMEYFSDFLFRYIETITGELCEAYTTERERWIRGAVAMRSQEVRSILAGTHVDMAESSRRLRYRLDAQHVGFVIWDDQPGMSDHEVAADPTLFTDMDRYAGEVAETLGAGAALSVPIGRLYAGWAAVSGEPDLSAVPRASNGLRVAVGRPGRGIGGFRKSHEEALLARRVASLSQRSTPWCTGFDKVALDALLTTDLDQARGFVTHEIGPLLDDSDAVRRLAATVEIFLQEDSSYVRAARRLGVHENTVTYRVKRAEELLGRRTTERQLELRAALRMARLVRDADAAG